MKTRNALVSEGISCFHSQKAKGQGNIEALALAIQREAYLAPTVVVRDFLPSAFCLSHTTPSTHLQFLVKYPGNASPVRFQSAFDFQSTAAFDFCSGPMAGPPVREKSGEPCSGSGDAACTHSRTFCRSGACPSNPQHQSGFTSSPVFHFALVCHGKSCASGGQGEQIASPLSFAVVGKIDAGRWLIPCS